jgi:ribosomal protein L34E
MAIMLGMKCLNCEKKDARRDSHYCSDKCGARLARRHKGPVQCLECGAEEETVAQAKKAGWLKVSMDEEGISYNYSGYCPECKDEM